MMSFSPFAPARWFAALPLSLAAALLCIAPSGHAADDPDAGGTFNAPGYPARNAPGGNGQNGQGGQNGQNQNGAANGTADGQAGATPGRGNGAANAPLNSRGNSANPRAIGNADQLPQRRTLLPPPKPTEFQRFVEGATGRLLPIFGSRFFADAADTYQSLDNVPVSADYTVGPGDEIVTRAWGSIDIDYRATVDRNGMLNLPKIGSFNVAGVKASDLERNLRAQIGRLYTNFDLSVSLGQLRGLRVFIVGPAQRPGVVTLPSQSTLLSA
ncbi:MAG: polysaccharide biosynthesis/export family protein, partial [Pseudomonadota bacterium]|nr:polysaccharide biosynthesis/export family protein [Pseudomonadota bacterium]